MDPLKPAQIRSVLANLPDLADHFANAVIYEAILYGGVPTFDELQSDGWRLRHDGHDLKRLAAQLFQALGSDDHAHLVIVCDARTEQGDAEARRKRVNVTMAIAIRGVKQLLYSNEDLNTFLHFESHRLHVVTIEDDNVFLHADRGRQIIEMIQQTHPPRSTLDLVPPDFD